MSARKHGPARVDVNFEKGSKEAVTFFEKKITKKTFAPGGVWIGIAFNRRRWGR
jgi:hypothetical protein